MSETSNLTVHTDGLIHYKNSSWPAKFANFKTVLPWFLIVIVVSALGGLLGGAIGPLVFYTIGLGFVFPICFFAGLVLGVSVLWFLRFADRRLFGAVKAAVTALEDRFIDGTTPMSREDLEKLVAGSLKLKRLAAADIYSRRLLALSMLPPEEAMKTADWLVTTECWASTEEFHRGWHYKMIWVFETRGVLTLTPDSLNFESKKFVFHCHPSQVSAIRVKRHPLWMKPIPLKFISITIEDCGGQHIFNITPSFGQTDTVWDCNRMVDTWVKRLEKARSSPPKSLTDSTSAASSAYFMPASFMPDTPSYGRAQGNA